MHIKLLDFARFLSMPLSFFSVAVTGVDGFVSGAGPVRFYFLAQFYPLSSTVLARYITADVQWDSTSAIAVASSAPERACN